jgi:PAS domain S-box-containing protein
MQIRGEIGGALVVQSYEEGIQYGAEDADILGFVANHVSAAIERYQALDALRTSEERYRTVIDNVGVGVAVVQDSRMVFANPTMVRITGYPLEQLLSQAVTTMVHPEDVPGMIERHQRRLRGEAVDPSYCVRIRTRSGEERTIELSAVLIEWGKRKATLLFMVDVSARMQAEQAQRAALQQQIELNALKTRFISMASHEFRTPLATIRSSQDLLKHYADRLAADERREILDSIEAGVLRMTHMLDRVLLLSKADANMLEFRPQQLDLQALCEDIIADCANQHPLGNCELKLEYTADIAGRSFDEALLRHILGNLLSNAIKYSPAGGTVRLRVCSQLAQTVFEVSDQGIGIPAEEIPHLFESFHRASNVGSIAGTGLGLAIVRQSVELHGGQIAVHSAPGRGSTFSVSL